MTDLEKETDDTINEITKNIMELTSTLSEADKNIITRELSSLKMYSQLKGRYIYIRQEVDTEAKNRSRSILNRIFN